MAAARDGLAQSRSGAPLVAFFSGTSANAAAQYVSSFRLGLKEQGYVEGQNVDVTIRYAEGDLTRLSGLADEIVRLTPEAIVTGSTAATLAVRRATITIPTICAALTDPVGTGLIATDSRPEGNVTGILNNLDSLPGKRIELARELVPGAHKFGVLVNGSNESNIVQLRDTSTAAGPLALDIAPIDVRHATKIEPALRDLARHQIEVLLVLQDPMFNTEGKRIARLAVELQLPTVHGFRENVEDGGLLSYGINLRENFRRAAYFVTRVLQGTNPSDLPVELPTKIDLVINLKTAKALGLTIPPALLALADEVIE
jgi:putative ABC transport system substrate-binding protein